MFPHIHIGSLVIHSYGLMQGVAIVIGMALIREDFKRRHIPIPTTNLTVLIEICGVIGSKLDSAVVLHWQTGTPVFYGPPVLWLASGYTWLGSELTGVLLITLAARVYGQSVLRVLDTLPIVSLSCAIGRVGCFLAGDGDYGPPTTLPWGISFPHGVIPTLERVHPTMLYISAWELGIFLYLWPKGRPDRYRELPQGAILGQYLILTGCGRFLTEFLSRNSHVWLWMTEAQIVGTLFVLTGTILLLGLRVKFALQPLAITQQPEGVSVKARR